MLAAYEATGAWMNAEESELNEQTPCGEKSIDLGNIYLLGKHGIRLQCKYCGAESDSVYKFMEHVKQHLLTIEEDDFSLLMQSAAEADNMEPPTPTTTTANGVKVEPEHALMKELELYADTLNESQETSDELERIILSKLTENNETVANVAEHKNTVQIEPDDNCSDAFMVYNDKLENVEHNFLKKDNSNDTFNSYDMDMEKRDVQPEPDEDTDNETFISYDMDEPLIDNKPTQSVISSSSQVADDTDNDTFISYDMDEPLIDNKPTQSVISSSSQVADDTDNDTFISYDMDEAQQHEGDEHETIKENSTEHETIEDNSSYETTLTTTEALEDIKNIIIEEPELKYEEIEDLEFNELDGDNDNETMQLFDNIEYLQEYENELKTSVSVKKQLQKHPEKHTGFYKCDFCDKSFTFERNLLAHNKLHVAKRTYACKYCNSVFADRSNFRVHTYRHLGLKRHTCDICAKSFISSTELKLHVRSHTGERPFTCDYCDLKFTSSTHLTLHIRRHTEERPFECDKCGKRFYERRLLRDHEAVHSENRAFKCDICEMSFTRRRAQRDHMKTHVGVQIKTCKNCGASYRGAGAHVCKLKDKDKESEQDNTIDYVFLRC